MIQLQQDNPSSPSPQRRPWLGSRLPAFFLGPQIPVHPICPVFSGPTTPLGQSKPSRVPLSLAWGHWISYCYMRLPLYTGPDIVSKHRLCHPAQQVCQRIRLLSKNPLIAYILGRTEGKHMREGQTWDSEIRNHQAASLASPGLFLGRQPQKRCTPQVYIGVAGNCLGMVSVSVR